MLFGVKAPQAERRETADDRGRYLVQPEWIGQSTLINVGLIVLGIYLVSTLIGAGANDVPSRVAIVSLVVSMPLLAFLSMITELQRTRRYASYPWYLITAQSIAQGAAVLGFGAALWHVWFPAAIAFVVSGATGLLIYTFYYGRLEKDNRQERQTRRGKATAERDSD
jgi:O-antigen/teichoic acid export membrane protein